MFAGVGQIRSFLKYQAGHGFPRIFPRIFPWSFTGSFTVVMSRELDTFLIDLAIIKTVSACSFILTTLGSGRIFDVANSAYFTKEK